MEKESLESTIMNNNILLCSDMDRTVLPNGVQDESPRVRSVLRLLVERPEIQLAYVSGRDKRLIQKAITESNGDK